MLDKAPGKIIALGALLLAFLTIWAVGMSAAPASAQKARIPLDSPVTLNARTSVRDQPTHAGKVLNSLPANSRGVVLGGPFNTENWYWVDFTGGTKGYVPGATLVAIDSKFTPLPTSIPPTAGTRTPATATRTAIAPTVVTTPTVAPTSTPAADPVLGVYANLMLGEMNGGGNVRVAPGTENRKLKTWPQGRRVLLYQTEKDTKGDIWYRVSEAPEEPMWVHNSLLDKLEAVKFEAAKFKGKWINVNLTQQIVTAYEGAKPIKVTLASTGTAKDPTEIGTWKIYWRLPKQDMDGGNLAAGDYYSLKDVPFPQYFHTSGEGFHGTYWHDDFGKPRSHGCVNLSTPMSEWLYGFANIGTNVWIHN